MEAVMNDGPEDANVRSDVNESTTQPTFHPGLIVTDISMVVDKHGVAWWVNPCGRQILKATA